VADDPITIQEAHVEDLRTVGWMETTEMSTR
jgi:hypothetical protein